MVHDAAEVRKAEGLRTGMERLRGTTFRVILRIGTIGVGACTLIFGALLSLVPLGHTAETAYPSRPITLVVPFSAGGGADTGSKIIADRISEFLGQRVVSEYKPGAGGSIGAAFVAKSKPDGYTLMVGGTTSVVIAPLLKTNLGYTMEDLIPICGYSKVAVMINAKAGGRWNGLTDFISAAKQSSTNYTYGTFGALSQAHFVMEMLARKADVRLTHVPFDGSPKANAALIGGHVDLSVTNATGGLYKAGMLKILAVAEEKRLEDFPEVPTLTELGYPIVTDSQYCLMVPKATPPEIVAKLYDANKKAFEKYGKEMTDDFRNIEQIVSFIGPDESRQKYEKDGILYTDIARTLAVLAQ
jgi:tripartite-type tricarboxylate transporter receptor subunit TctC